MDYRNGHSEVGSKETDTHNNSLVGGGPSLAQPGPSAMSHDEQPALVNRTDVSEAEAEDKRQSRTNQANVRQQEYVFSPLGPTV